MRIEIDDKSGFCFGVVNAIGKAEQALREGAVYSLGDIVHNRLEVQRLQRLGLETVSHSDLDRLGGKTLLVRAHGEPPCTYEKARRFGINVIDATCPVVARLQRKVAEAYEKMKRVNGQVVILGKKGHAEVVGLTGQIGDDCTVVECERDLDALDFSRPVYLLSQTTQSLELFRHVERSIEERIYDASALTVNDTICRQVSSREQHLREFAARYDAVVFVCGRKSSNGRVLFEVCRSANARTYNVEDSGELRPEWFEGVESVGVCGATSTPKWLMERLAEAIDDLCR
ncbi:MAG: 4-hydroxy-3-methylbut-2-enyl diphosphate reductase [Alistipes putredinis]|nr:MAG: 4-hydroxy-3-methylbut-2-enyl diphosphate reductase [Alistipes putredinis]